MRILYHSAAPWTSSGYARVTREVAPRLHNEGHEVALQSMSSIRDTSITWHGDELYYDLERPMTVYPAEPSGRENMLGTKMAGSNFEEFDADLYYTHFDTWTERVRDVIPSLGIKYSSYVIVDHYPVPEEVIDQILGAQKVVSMSKFAKHHLEQEGIPSVYIPHGVNQDRYFPLDDEFIENMSIETIKGDGSEKSIDVKDHFIVGIVAANHGDRKNIPHQLRAFKMFVDEVDDDAILYIHTQMDSSKGFNLVKVKDEIGIPDKNVIFTRAEDYGNVDDDYLNSLYNTFDVFLNCSIGESWGLTITEAQAAGVPCVVTNFSSMPEQLGIEPTEVDWESYLDEENLLSHSSYKEAPHGLLVNPKTSVWRSKVNSRQYMAHPEDIKNAIERYYEDEELREKHGERASEFVRENYTWGEHVVPKFSELFSELERRFP